MKAVVLVAMVLLAVSCGEALRCNRCINKGCRNTVETCSSPNDVCARVMFLPPMPVNYFRRCMKASDCHLMTSVPNVSAFCCSTDLCN
ncbi:phospholipase A2 inhibitor and Ly6/PLAUR domain-containing protein-like [Brienomyrus brachyistius]|uniref:phospholipase A2 inhibitor and Ly6/PLAUR domain-containing protein-like n=1 Tax=Brienomyrus brachyistius TaxID=42636 RepID=UPI0020B1BF95|nr:phospholipase A2 inhibitor and Ly6/PLAUR domain-containing protein-like [Brienomyrus brachyistius]